MVKHQPLQVYERQLCLSCLTGIYGCRWKRYQRSHDETTKWECLWSFILFCTFSLLLVWFYFWWEAHNDYSEFNWFLYNRSGEWSDGTVPILAITAAGFTYIAFLMILALCHVGVGQQLNLHWLHKIGVTVALLSTIIGVISVTQMWWEEWDVIWISLQVAQAKFREHMQRKWSQFLTQHRIMRISSRDLVLQDLITLLLSMAATGPFLHIGALAAVTALAWLISGQVARAEKTRFQVMVLLIYLCALLTLYFIPLSITSPCIMDRGSLKAPPGIIGHQGAPMIAPENTLLSFHRALQRNVSGLETEVTISLDGVPFLMRDRTLRRTTNVRRVFPEREYEDPSFFNWTDLRSLSAGEWFLKDDPFWTVKYMSQSERWLVGNQTVCSLEQMLKLAARSRSLAVFTLHRPPHGHPHYHDWVNLTLDTVLRSGIPERQVMWTVDSDREMVRQVAPGLQQTSLQMLPLNTLHHKGIDGLLLRYNQPSGQDVRLYNEHNISLILYSVNEPWLYSLLWCSGVPTVSSEAPQVLRKLHSPLWLMSPEEYSLIWICADVISFAVIIGIFIFQNYHMIRWRMSGMRSYNPEQIMLSAAVRRSSREVNIMKEKLIFSEVSNGVNSDEAYMENGYNFYSN